jgi:hypothetical protein
MCLKPDHFSLQTETKVIQRLHWVCLVRRLTQVFGFVFHRDFIVLRVLLRLYGIVGRRSELGGPLTLWAKKEIPFKKFLLLSRKINQNQQKKTKMAKNHKKSFNELKMVPNSLFVRILSISVSFGTHKCPKILQIPIFCGSQIEKWVPPYPFAEKRVTPPPLSSSLNWLSPLSPPYPTMIADLSQTQC